MALASIDEQSLRELAKSLSAEDRAAVHQMVIDINELINKKGDIDSRIASNNAYVQKARKEQQDSLKEQAQNLAPATLIAAPSVITSILIVLQSKAVRSLLKDSIAEKIEDIALGLFVDRERKGKIEMGLRKCLEVMQKR